MSARRVNPRRFTMSRAAKQILKDKKRKRKLVIPEKQPEDNRTGMWILGIGALIALGLIVALIVAKSAL